ncbi:MAG: putative ABC transporter ATP-binding protein [Fimbriimonadaceae bacterium]|nr:putative ABC transporter ATP-binding protein [Fimbriimonadaceae bacterium]
MMGYGVPTGDAPKKLDRETLRRIVRLFVPHRALVVKTLLAMIVGVGLGVVPPYLLGKLFDDGIAAKNLTIVTEMSILTIVVTLAAAGFTLLYGWLSVLLGQEIMCDMRHKLFVHLQGMPLAFFTGTKTGEIQTRMISDVGGVQNVVSNTLTDALSNFAILVSTVIVMFAMDWRLTLVSIALVPLIGSLSSKVGQAARKIRTGVQEQTSEVNSMIQETLSVSGVLLTKTTGRLDLVTQKFDRENRKLADWQIKAQVLMYSMFGLFRMIMSLSPAVVYWVAGWLLINQGDTSLTVGKLIAFTALQTRMFFPLTGLANSQVEVLSSYALFGRIFEYEDLDQAIKDKPDAKRLDPGQVLGRVQFDHATFRYSPELEEPTLADITFTAEPGQLVALVGPSGAGKTTLTYLIPRLWDVESGSVRIDGHDVRDVQLASLQQCVGAVTQETYLLHDTIKENLRVARPEASDEDLVEACKLAAIHFHIASLPEGYDTVVGERGYKLSGGEKQRLAIARAILKDPRILILDEATSALDTETERQIQASLSTLMKGRTTFAIAHRLSTIIAADQILVIDGGRLVEHGRHDELLARGGTYRRLYNEQFRMETTLPVG